jgi:hypothetical protein
MSAGLMAAGSLRVAYGAMAIAVAVAGGASLLAFLSAHDNAGPESKVAPATL